MRVAIPSLVIVAALLICNPAYADEQCGGTATLYSGHANCVRDADQVRNLYATAASDGYKYKLVTRCKQGQPNCGRDERICRNQAGASGTWYVLRRITDATGAVTNMGIVCLTPADESDLAVITPAMVRREMQRLSWPTAELSIQPPDGQTLINFDTNFFTDNTAPTTQVITLLGQQVTIEATPTAYTWHFGDGTARTTTGPGAAYPDLDVTHDYADPGRVSPSADTTYHGRYRVNNDGWQAIPGSLTVPGGTVALRVRSASPHLVGYDH